MNIDYPYRIDESGRTATAGDERHIRNLIEQVLFTSPGERVNRPEFGSGLLQLVFAPNGDALANATQSAVQGALQRWLGHLIRVEAVEVTSLDASIVVRVNYIHLRNQQRQSATFEKSV